MEKILVFQHVKHEHARRFTDLAGDLGVKYETINFWKKYKKPNLKDYSRLIVMGGPQSVYGADFPSKNFEIEAIKNFTKIGKPVLGCCLGSQLIAHAFGAKVYPNMINGKKFKETGFYKMLLTKKGCLDSVFKNFPREFDVFHWHGDIFHIPKNADLLATGDFVKNQAFKIRDTNTYGMLFHFDFLPLMVEELIRADNKWLHAGNEIDEEEIIKKAYRFEPQIKKLSAILFKSWMKL